MTVLFKISAAGALALSLAACATAQGSGASDTGWTATEPYAPHGSKGVTPEQAEWLARSHARPAGR